MSNSTFSGNSAGSGGGIRNFIGTLTVSNSTFSGNSAGSGGGILNTGPLAVTVINSTFASNGAGRGSGISSDGTLFLRNTVIANSLSGQDCIFEGTVFLQINNLIEDGSCSSLLSGDPNLGPLANNGGPTQTHALLAGSPAIDAGDPATCALAPVNNLDQRGIARPHGAACDIGAYEYDIVYNFGGFFQPLDNLPLLNAVKAGSGIPVKFSLAGNQGLSILAASYPQSQPIACDSAAPIDDIEQTVAAGGSSLSYDASNDQYVYVWKTDTTWASSCRQLIARLADGADHRANFKFK